MGRDQVGLELVSQIGRDTNPEAGHFAGIILLNDLSHRVKAAHDLLLMVGDTNLNELPDWLQHSPQLREEGLEPLLLASRDRYRFGKLLTIHRGHFGGSGLVDFIEDHERGLLLDSDIGEDRIHRIHLLGSVGMAGIHHVDEQVGLDDLFEVALNASTRPCGNLRMNPTVSLKSTF